MNYALVKTEKEFHDGYKMYVNQKNTEMKELINKFKERTSKLSIKDEKIKKLEIVIHDLRHQLFVSEEQKELKIKEAMRWKMKGDILDQDKQFLEKQLKDSRKQNRLLKIAISKLQNDFERLARQTKGPINISYSLHEDVQSNLLSQLDKVITEHQDLGQDLSNKEVLEKLDEANTHMNAIAQTKLNSYTAYTDENHLREKLIKSEKKPRSESRANLQNSTKSYQKYESPKKNLSFNRSYKPSSKHKPIIINNTQNVSAIKHKLGNDEKWNKF
jgi:hypothetical protein